MMKIDISLISGRRPDLLERTLESFSKSLFSNFTIGKLYVNIDPIFGDVHDEEKTEQVIRSYFPEAQVNKPNNPGFCTAVKTAWQATTEDFLFHLEDDWVLIEPITPKDISPFFTSRVAAVQLVSKEHGWKGEEYKQAQRKKRFLGLPIGKETINIFGTSPGFWRGDVARKCAELMDETLDPEKQMRPPLNPKLNHFLKDYKCRMLGGKTQSELITDIGRAWRDERRITKTVIAGNSIWENN